MKKHNKKYKKTQIILLATLGLILFTAAAFATIAFEPHAAIAQQISAAYDDKGTEPYQLSESNPKSQIPEALLIQLQQNNF